jgi:UDP-N-acetylmuramoylalanine--D-glutamate ligase
MAAEFSVKGQRVVVIGAARSGVAAAELLVRRGADVTLTELKPSIPQGERLHDLGVHLETGGHRPETFERAQLIVTSPGVPLELPDLARAQGRGVPVVGEIELASRWVRGRIVAITGTKGKSTTGCRSVHLSRTQRQRPCTSSRQAAFSSKPPTRFIPGSRRC